MTNKLLFSTFAYQYLAEDLLQNEKLSKGDLHYTKFPDGETYHRIETPVNRRNVVLLGGTIDDENTLELYDLAQGIIHAGADSLEIVIPYFGYSTMEREVKPGEIVKAKNRALLFSALPPCAEANKVYLMDLHSEGLPYYFDRDIRCKHVYCKSIVMDVAKQLGGEEFVLASTDAGRAKWVESLANEMHVKSAFVYKHRFSGHSTEITGVNADVKDKTVIIYDDMIRTGGSLIQAAEAYAHAGAKTVYAITTHGLFTNHAIDKIASHGLIQKVVCTNTHPNALEQNHPLLEVKSVSNVIFDALN